MTRFKDEEVLYQISREYIHNIYLYIYIYIYTYNDRSIKWIYIWITILFINIGRINDYKVLVIGHNLRFVNLMWGILWIRNRPWS